MKPRILSRTAAWVGVLVLAGGGVALAAKDKTAEAWPVDRPPLRLQVDSNPIDRSPAAHNSFAPVVKQVSPSVVAVYSSKKVRQQDMNQLFNDPVFRHFFGAPGQGQGGEDEGGDNGNGNIPGNGRHSHESIQQSLGSGVIVSSDGYVITNNHVVADADDVKIKFGQPEKEYKATIVGRDAEADVAVLKIDATGLTAAKLGDSDQLQVGDTVLAMGDPFGIGLTVTHGIVSALGRNSLNIEAYEDFIQTDAPINPGNSGGGLFDSEGRLVGINTAILSHSGGSNGVGFAIPINLVRALAEQLIHSGKVARGFLGVALQPLTPDLATQFGVTSGALVSDVSPKTPASRAGLKAGDIITRMDGKAVEDFSQLRLAVSEMIPGTSVVLDVVRDGKPLTFKVRLEERPTKALAGAEHAVGSSDQGVLNGVTVGDITAEMREQLQLPSEVNGAVITEVDPDSASAKAGLARGDVILELERKPVHNADEAVKLSDEIKGPKVLVRLWRGGTSRYVVVDETPATP
jgi:serine protease Do